MKTLAFTVLAASLFLTGCVTTNGYQEPVPGNTAQPPATIKNYDDDSMTSPQYASIQSIDGKKRQYDIFPSVPAQSTKLMPGAHDLVISNGFNPGFFSLPRASTAELNANLKPGENYQLQMSVDKNHTLTWLTDSQGNRASDVAKAPFKITPGEGVIVIPVVR